MICRCLSVSGMEESIHQLFQSLKEKVDGLTVIVEFGGAAVAEVNKYYSACQVQSPVANMAVMNMLAASVYPEELQGMSQPFNRKDKPRLFQFIFLKMKGKRNILNTRVRAKSSQSSI